MTIMTSQAKLDVPLPSPYCPTRIPELRIRRGWLKSSACSNSKNAVLVCPLLYDDAIQQLAEETGGCVADSLEMARFVPRHDATRWWWAGFASWRDGEILSPDKRILMPTLEATCSLDIGCPADEFSAFLRCAPRIAPSWSTPNTSAAVKARADWVVTSSIAVEVIEHPAGKGRENSLGA